MLTRPLPIGRFLALLLGTVVMCAAVAVALPHAPYIRYQSLNGTIFDRAQWIFERIHFDDTPIDVAFIGSSRTARGAVPTMIEAELAKRGADVRVVNFSMPASGFDIRYTKARELLESREVGLLVISVVEALPRDGHQAFGDLGRTDEILASPWIVNRTLPGNLARLPVRQMQLALASALPEAFGYRAAFDPAGYPGATIDSRRFSGWTPEAEAATLSAPDHAEALARESRQRKREITPPILPESLAWAEFGVSRSYIERIAALAEATDTRLAFLFLPFFEGYQAPLEQAWLESLGPVWIADFMMHDPQNYIDAAHASTPAAERLAGWLAGHVAAALTAEAPTRSVEARTTR